jgi:hypothetical protein
MGLKEFKQAQEAIFIADEELAEPNREVDMFKIILALIQGNSNEGQKAINYFYRKHSFDDTTWLKKELSLWGIQII